MANSPIIVGIDPATGVSSPTGVAVIHGPTRTILGTFALHAKDKKLEHRIKRLSEVVEAIVSSFLDVSAVDCHLEYFVMKGKGGEMLQRLIGSFMGRMPVEVNINHVHNTTLKKVIAGHGHSSKAEVAEGVLRFFAGHPVSEAHVRRLILLKKWDELDSLAIAIVGMFQEVEK